MGALCWVLPLEEDADILEEGEGGRLVELLEEVACCLGCQRPPDGFALLVKHDGSSLIG